MRATKDLVYSALFTALIIAGTYVRVPVGPVPIVLATLFVLLSGLLQKLAWTITSVALYLVLGAVGLPVFSGGGGLAYFAGPTGGYLVGYLLAAVVVNLISTPSREGVWRDLVAVVAGSLAIYLVGVPRLKAALDFSWAEALSAGLLPFLIGDAIKAAVAFSAFVALKRTYPELIPRSEPPKLGE